MRVNLKIVLRRGKKLKVLPLRIIFFLRLCHTVKEIIDIEKVISKSSLLDLHLPFGFEETCSFSVDIEGMGWPTRTTLILDENAAF